VGVKGRRIAHDSGPGSGIGMMIKVAVEQEANLNVIEQDTVDKFLLILLRDIRGS
jgi:hypothetical protein